MTSDAPNAANDNQPRHGGARRRQPLELEFRAKRIHSDLWLTSDRFERTWRKFAHADLGQWSGTRFDPRHSDPAASIGAEHAAGAMLEDRYVAARLTAPLYGVLVRLCVFDAALSEVAGENFPGQSDRIDVLTIRGRERAICALRLCEAAHEDFDAMVDGRRPRLGFALGDALPFADRGTVEAANDNARTVGGAVQRATLRRWRVNESALA